MSTAASRTSYTPAACRRGRRPIHDRRDRPLARHSTRRTHDATRLLRQPKKGPMAREPSVQFLRISEQVRGRNTCVRNIGMITGG